MYRLLLFCCCWCYIRIKFFDVKFFSKICKINKFYIENILILKEKYTKCIKTIIFLMLTWGWQKLAESLDFSNISGRGWFTHWLKISSRTSHRKISNNPTQTHKLIPNLSTIKITQSSPIKFQSHIPNSQKLIHISPISYPKTQ